MLRTYRCRNSTCRHEFQLDIPVTSILESRKHVKAICPTCGSRRCDKLITDAPPVIFKAKGYYTSDNRKETSNDLNVCTVQNNYSRWNDVRNTKMVGFSMWAECKYCNGRICVSELWRKTKIYVVPEGKLDKKGVVLE